MHSYYFNIRCADGSELEDPDGLELPDLDAARDECRKLIAAVVHEETRATESEGNAFHVVDEVGRNVLVVPFSAISRGARDEKMSENVVPIAAQRRARGIRS